MDTGILVLVFGTLSVCILLTVSIGAFALFAARKA